MKPQDTIKNCENYSNWGNCITCQKGSFYKLGECLSCKEKDTNLIDCKLSEDFGVCIEHYVWDINKKKMHKYYGI